MKFKLRENYLDVTYNDNSFIERNIVELIKFVLKFLYCFSYSMGVLLVFFFFYLLYKIIL